MKPSLSINSYMNREKVINKRLVKILNFKMFKGYRISRQSKILSTNKPKNIRDNLWDNKTIDPFDDFYNIEYKRKNLSSLYTKDYSNMLQINNIPKKSSEKTKIIKKMNVQTQKGKSFQKNSQMNLEKEVEIPEQYFYFCSNSQYIKKNPKENKEKKDKLYNTIFQDRNEKGLYNDIPIFAIEKIYRLNNSNKNKNKFKYLKSREERISDLQFLYKVSHGKPLQKRDFRIKYNIKSAKPNILENEMIRNLSCYSVKNPKLLNSKNCSYVIKDYNNVNNSMNIRNINNELKKNFSFISKKNKSVNEMGTQLNDFHLPYSSSAEDLFINKSKLIRINKEKDKEKARKSISYLYPTNRRIINTQLLKQQQDFQKWKFNNLKNIMEA